MGPSSSSSSSSLKSRPKSTLIEEEAAYQCVNNTNYEQQQNNNNGCYRFLYVVWTKPQCHREPVKVAQGEAVASMGVLGPPPETGPAPSHLKNDSYSAVIQSFQSDRLATRGV
ncbi:unnamed protein product [Pleuronectes platessa]|uniref:Uncharacterized protein n=1 Tax=Pleuronectes platessa TaxID=8262 RepID=A0A9N7VTF1_PLEPL|nr:unnamed protein product [Pleuronectes platessa]